MSEHVDGGDSNSNYDVLIDENDSNENEDVPVSSENQEDEFAQPGQDNEDVGVTITRSGRISWPREDTLHFPEAANFQEGNEDDEGRRMRPYYFDDEDVKEKLSHAICCRDSYFTEDAQAEELSCRELTDEVKR